MPFLFVAKHPCSLGGWKIRTIEDFKKAAIKLFYGACSANMSKSQTAGHAEFWEKASAVDALWWIDRQL